MSHILFKLVSTSLGEQLESGKRSIESFPRIFRFWLLEIPFELFEEVGKRGGGGYLVWRRRDEWAWWSITQKAGEIQRCTFAQACPNARVRVQYDPR